MPAADEKVILSVKLDMKDATRQFKGVDKEITKLRKEITSAAKESKQAWDNQKKSVEELAKSVKKAGTEASRSEKQRQKDIKNTTEELKKQASLLQKLKTQYSKLRESRPGRAAAWTGRGMMGMASMAGGFLMGGLQSAYGTYLQHGIAQRALMGTGMTRGQLGGQMRGGARLGITPMATTAQAGQVARLAGAGTATNLAQQFAIAGGGMGVGEAAGVMGALRGGGLRFDRALAGKGPGGQPETFEARATKRLERIMAAGMATGIEKARLPEYLQNVAAGVQMMGTRKVGAVDLDAINTSLGMIARMPGMKDPQRQMALARRIDASIRTPGGGEAGQMFTLRALGWGKQGPGGVRYMEALRRQEMGFGGEEGARNLFRIVQEGIKQFGAEGAGGMSPVMDEFRHQMKEMYGIEQSISGALADVVNDLGKDEDKAVDRIQKEWGKKGLSIQEQIRNETKKGLAGVAKYVADLELTNIGIGSKGAKGFMELQKLQIKMLKFMSTYLPQIAENIKISVNYIKDLVDSIRKWFNEKEGAWNTTKNIIFGGNTEQARKDFRANQKWAEEWREKNYGTASNFRMLRERQAKKIENADWLAKGVRATRERYHQGAVPEDVDQAIIQQRKEAMEADKAIVRAKMALKRAKVKNIDNIHFNPKQRAIMQRIIAAPLDSDEQNAAIEELKLTVGKGSKAAVQAARDPAMAGIEKLTEYDPQRDTPKRKPGRRKAAAPSTVKTQSTTTVVVKHAGSNLADNVTRVTNQGEIDVSATASNAPQAQAGT